MYIGKKVLRKAASIFLKVTVAFSGALMVTTGYQVAVKAFESIAEDDLGLKIKEEKSDAVS